MPTIIRHTAVWTGAPGLPGYTQFHREVTAGIPGQAQTSHDQISTFFGVFASLIPADITVTVSPVYQIIDVATGMITSEDTVGDPSAPIAGAFVSTWSGQVGVLVEWLTGTFIGGRRLRGRTYLVPLGNVGDDDGTLPGGTISTLQSASAYITQAGAEFVVWHRPVANAGGQVSTITSAVIRDHAAVLRSRRV